MARTSTYLNFLGSTEEAFTHYAGVFGTEGLGPIQRFGDLPSEVLPPTVTDEELTKVMHVELPILGGHIIMGTDMLASMGHDLRVGNNTTINLECDSREEADRLFLALSEGGSEMAEMAEMPWGYYWGVVLDRFSIRWMLTVPLES